MHLTEKMMARPDEGGAQKARAELRLRGRVDLRSLLTFHHILLPSPVLCHLGCQHTERLPPRHVFLRATHRLVCFLTSLSKQVKGLSEEKQGSSPTSKGANRTLTG